MGRILLSAVRPSMAVDQAAARLQGHFGAARVVPVDVDAGDLRPGDVLVVFVQTPIVDPVAGSASNGRTTDSAGNGQPLDDARIAAALAASAPIIPVLVDGAVMPAANQLPETIRSFAFQHALPLRSDSRLRLDAGRLIVDLESQLRRVVGDHFSFEYWLAPLGVLFALVGALYADTYWHDVHDWSFAYETVDDLQHGMRWLLFMGPASLGAGLGMLAAAVWWRRRRKQALQRAEHFRQGTGEAPRLDNALAFGCLTAGTAALGWGAFAAAPALILGICALLTRGERPLGRAGGWAVLLGIAAAAAGSLWTTQLWSSERALRAAIASYELGRREFNGDDGSGDAAKAQPHFVKATEIYPDYANAHFRLAQSLERQSRSAEALDAVDRAIALYPAEGQDLFGPAQQIAADAYSLRAALHDQRGETELAQQDREMMGRVTGWINILGGMFRFWEGPARPAWE